jgi:hypothetical protein
MRSLLQKFDSVAFVGDKSAIKRVSHFTVNKQTAVLRLTVPESKLYANR